jgi:hypothetical protein
MLDMSTMSISRQLTLGLSLEQFIEGGIETLARGNRKTSWHMGRNSHLEVEEASMDVSSLDRTTRPSSFGEETKRAFGKRNTL